MEPESPSRRSKLFFRLIFLFVYTAENQNADTSYSVYDQCLQIGDKYICIDTWFFDSFYTFLTK